MSAALFFGSLIPLAVKARSSLVLPAFTGSARQCRCSAFAVLIAVGARSVGRAFSALSRVEWWAPRTTGVVFLGIGLYYSLKFIFILVIPGDVNALGATKVSPEGSMAFGLRLPTETGPPPVVDDERPTVPHSESTAVAPGSRRPLIP